MLKRPGSTPRSSATRASPRPGGGSRASLPSSSLSLCWSAVYSSTNLSARSPRPKEGGGEGGAAAGACCLMSSSSAEIFLSNSLSLSSDSWCPFCISLNSCSMRRKRWSIWALSVRWARCSSRISFRISSSCYYFILISFFVSRQNHYTAYTLMADVTAVLPKSSQKVPTVLGRNSCQTHQKTYAQTFPLLLLPLLLYLF